MKISATVVFVLAAACSGSLTAATYCLDYRRQPVAEASEKPFAKAAALKESVAAPAGSRVEIPAAEAPKIAEELSVGDVLAISLFDDADAELTLIERTPTAGRGRAAFIASSGGCGMGDAVVVQTPEGLLIDVQDVENGRVLSVAASPEKTVVKKAVVERWARDCEGAVPVPPQAAAAKAAAVVSAVPPKAAAAKAAAIVDVLVAYDLRAAEWVDENGGGMENFAEVSVQKMNAALGNTGIDEKFRFRLVGTYKIKGDAGVKQNDSLLKQLKAAQKGTKLNGVSWAGVKKKRDAVGADVVCVFVDSGETYGSSGIAYYYTQEMYGYFADWAYCVCAVRATSVGEVMTHEIGHLMGAGHDDYMADKANRGPQYHDYSRGCYFTSGEKRYHTIMAYNYDGDGNYYDAVPFFSSPDYEYDGVAVGDSMHNNTRTLRQTFTETAAFRDRSAVKHNVKIVRSGGSSKCKVTGGGSYLAGKKINLKATAGTGYVFAGWYRDAAFATPYTDGGDCRIASVSYIVNDDYPQIFYARFVKTSKDKTALKPAAGIDGGAFTCEVNRKFTLPLGVQSYSLPKITVKGLPEGMAFDEKTGAIAGKAKTAGVYAVKLLLANAAVTKARTCAFTITVVNRTAANFLFVNGLNTDRPYLLSTGVAFSLDCRLTGGEMTVNGLPSGIGYDAEKECLSGVPKTAGDFTVTFTVAAGGAKYVSTALLSVSAFDIRFAGTYRGGAEGVGTVTLKVSKSGKLSGTISEVTGKTLKLSAQSFDGFAAGGGQTPAYEASVAVKGSGTNATERMHFEMIEGVPVMSGGAFRAVLVDWKKKPWKSAVAGIGGKKLTRSEGGRKITLTFAADGTVKVACKLTVKDATGVKNTYKISGTTTLLPAGTPDASGRTKCFVFVCYPSAGGLHEGYCTLIGVTVKKSKVTFIH
ncbi:MAG: hypothetical protein J6T01_00215 [Kiritimatiellae bacterium]|nr:hypothetical protein [Kiritimatiellia bacterium]